MAADVADAGDLLRGDGFFIAFFFIGHKISINADTTRFIKGAGIYQKNSNPPQKIFGILVAHAGRRAAVISERTDPGLLVITTFPSSGCVKHWNRKPAKVKRGVHVILLTRDADWIFTKKNLVRRHPTRPGQKNDDIN